MQDIISISTSKKQELIDITHQISEIVKRSKVKEGICLVYVLHTSASIIINENADPNIYLDLIDSLNEQIPQGKWRHDKIDGNADAHIKASILGPSESIPIKDNKLRLGTWQAPILVEFDGPRTRNIVIQILGD